MKTRKIVNVLMWVPFLGLIVGIIEFIRVCSYGFIDSEGKTWFGRVGLATALLNGMYVGLCYGLL